MEVLFEAPLSMVYGPCNGDAAELASRTEPGKDVSFDNFGDTADWYTDELATSTAISKSANHGFCSSPALQLDVPSNFGTNSSVFQDISQSELSAGLKANAVLRAAAFVPETTNGQLKLEVKIFDNDASEQVPGAKIIFNPGASDWTYEEVNLGNALALVQEGIQLNIFLSCVGGPCDAGTVVVDEVGIYTFA